MDIRKLIDTINSGPDDPDEMSDAELADWWAGAALRLATASRVALDPPRHVIRVRYRHVDLDGVPEGGEVELPSWCTGSPAAAVALYLFGHAKAVDDYSITAEVVS